ncbi:MAG: dipeptidase [Halieaceae bacterium]|jgi:dipeptidase
MKMKAFCSYRQLPWLTRMVTCLILLCSWAGPAWSSYAIYIGKNLTSDGSVMLGGSGDEPSSHWLEVVPARDHAPGATITVGVTPSANMPGELTQIPQAEHTFRYLTMDYSEYEGFPPPLTNGGLNEHNLAARDVWSPSRPELVAMTPNPQQGPQYSDLSRIAMERARSAREAVEILGALIDQYGYSTYGGNSHLFADENEGWVFINYAGGEGLWVAERLGPDDVRMSYPGYIGNVPTDIHDREDYRASSNFISFAVEQGWYSPDVGAPFNVTLIYGVDEERYPRSEMERELRAEAPIDLRRMMDAVRDPRISKDSTGYGQVAQLQSSSNSELNLLWVAATQSVTAPFIPYRIATQSIAPQFGRHRYLSHGEAESLLTSDWQIYEGTEFALRTFKRLMYFACDRPGEFLPEVTRAFTAFEDRMITEQNEVVSTAQTLYDAEKQELARAYLTRYSHERGEEGLHLGNALLQSIESRTRVQYGYREPTSGKLSEVWGERLNCLPKNGKKATVN